MLAKSGQNFQSLRTTVYTRVFHDVGSGNIRLQKVAAFPPPAPASAHGAATAAAGLADVRPQDTLLLHLDNGWSVQDGAPSSTSRQLEDCLTSQEVVMLPGSSSLVFPLVDSSVLVGILLVELTTHDEQQQAHPEQQQHVQEQGQNLFGGARTASNAGAGPGPGSASAAGSGGSTSGSVSRTRLPLLCSGHDMASMDGGAGQATSEVALSDDVLHCLRLAVPLLEKACAMSARNTLQLMQASAQSSAAAGVLREARRPLSTLNTFGTMLVPRLKEGEPELDMAKSILMQGKRLSEVLWQLEDALHGPPAQQQQPAMPLSMASQQRSLDGLPLASSSPSHLLGNDMRPVGRSLAVSELLRLPRPIKSAGAAAAATGAAAASPPGSGSAASASSSSKPEALPELLPAPTPSPAPPAASATGHSSPQLTGLSGPGPGLGASFTVRQPSYSARPDALQPSSAPMATIDLELDTDAHRPAGLQQSCASGPAQGSGRHAGARGVVAAPSTAVSAAGQPGAVELPQAVSCNVISALFGILTAAAKMAAASGIHLIVNAPLTAAVLRRRGSPKAGPAATAGRRAGQHGAKAHLGGACAQDAVQLMPRPPRPLFVGVRAAVVQKVFGYVLDIALQCTPRGGQLCISARQDGSGVQLVVLHTGRMDLHRLHARSAPMGPGAAAATPGAAPGAEQAVMAGGGRRSAAAAGAAAAGSVRSGSGVLSVAMAQQLARQAGGHITVSYPCNMVNAKTGNLDVGTSVEVWLPGPAGSAQHAA